MIGVENSDSDRPLKPRRPKSRQVSSRFLSATVTPPTSPTVGKPAVADDRKNRSLEDSVSGNENSLLTKENHKPSSGGSADKFRAPAKTSLNSPPFSSESSTITVPGRHSADENVSAAFRDSLEPESDNGSPKNRSFSQNSSPAASPRRPGKQVASKYLSDLQTWPHRGYSSDTSPEATKFSIRNALKRTNSIAAASPGRSGCSKPPSSPNKPKGVEKLFEYLFKSKSKKYPCLTYSGPRLVNGDDVHRLRLLHNRELQWRYVNARADFVNNNIAKHTEINLVCAWDGIRKLQHSVLQKRLQIKKEELKMKLNFILHSQMKLLETWGDMEMQHLSTVSETEECLHYVVCKVPCTEGAKMSPRSASMALRHASDLTASIESTLALFSPKVEETVSLLSKLAEVVAREKLLLEECCEALWNISILEIEERSLKCSAIQLKSWQKQH